MTTGVIVSLPPLVEQPPGQSSSNPAGLPGLTYTPAVPTFPQTWSGVQTFLPGTIVLRGTGAASNVLVQETLNGPVTVRQLAFTDISGSIATAQIPSAALTGTNDTNVTLTLGGSPTTALLAATSITLGWTGTLAAARLNANVVQAVTNDTNITGSISGQNLTFAWSGTLSATRGGFGANISTQSGVPIFTTGAATFTATTGTGSVVLANTPTLTTPVIGSGGLTMTGTVSGTQVFRGPSAASGTITLPAGTYSVVGDTVTQTLFAKSISAGGLTFLGSSSGSTIVAASATASGTLTLPAATDTLVGKATTDTLSNKTLVAPALGTPASGTLTNCTSLPLSGLGLQNAFTLVGNNTSGAAAPTAVDIAGLTAKASPAATDLVMISDQAASGAWKKATVSSVASAGSVASIAGNTGAFTLSNGITNSANDIRLDIGNLPGVTTNSNAAAGKLGEFVSSAIASGSAVALTSGVAADVTSISLTAGDWDVEGLVGFVTSASTSITTVSGYVTSVSATVPTAPNNTAPLQGGGMNFLRMAAFVPGPTSNAFQLSTGAVRVSLSATTTIYLGAFTGFSASTLQAYGYIGARRVR